MMADRPLSLIAAVGRNGVIGADNALPWRLPSDLKHFRQTTMGKPVLMGRRTYESIGRPLPGRFVIVLSRDPAFRPEGIEVARTIGEAMGMAGDIARRKAAAEIIGAGGAALYETLIGRAQRLYVTEVDLAPPGDARFPTIDAAAWRETARQPQPRAAGDDAAFALVTYDRR